MTMSTCRRSDDLSELAPTGLDDSLQILQSLLSLGLHTSLNLSNKVNAIVRS